MTPSALISLVCSKHPCIFGVLCSLGEKKKKANKLVCGPSLIKQDRFVCCFYVCSDAASISQGAVSNTALKNTAFIHHIKICIYVYVCIYTYIYIYKTRQEKKNNNHNNKKYIRTKNVLSSEKSLEPKRQSNNDIVRVYGDGVHIGQRLGL